jgi:hypothetical protein
MVSLSYDCSISISSIYSTILCNDLNMPISEKEILLNLIDKRDWANYLMHIKNSYCYRGMSEFLQKWIPHLMDEKLRSFVHWAMEGNDYEIKGSLLHYHLRYLTYGERRFLVKWWMKEGKVYRYSLSFFSKSCFPYLTNEERQPLINWAMEKRDSCPKRLLLQNCFPYLTQDKCRELAYWFATKGNYDDQSFLLENCLFKSTSAQQFNVIIIDWAMEKGDSRSKRLLLQNCFPYLTQDKCRELAYWFATKGNYDDQSFLLRNCLFGSTSAQQFNVIIELIVKPFLSSCSIDGPIKELYFLQDCFPYLTQDKCRELICRLIAHSYRYKTVSWLEICFSKSTPTQFNAIIELIKGPFLELPFESFCEVIKKANAELIALFLGKYHQKLTDGQFTTMIQKVGTMWAGKFLKNHFPQLKAPRFSLVIAMCSLNGMVRFLAKYASTLKPHQRQVIEQRAGDLFEL